MPIHPTGLIIVLVNPKWVGLTGCSSLVPLPGELSVLEVPTDIDRDSDRPEEVGGCEGKRAVAVVSRVRQPISRHDARQQIGHQKQETCHSC